MMMGMMMMKSLVMVYDTHWMVTRRSHKYKKNGKSEASTKNRRKIVTLDQTPEAMIFALRWRVLSTEARFVLVIAIRPSSRTNAKDPKAILGLGTFWESSRPYGAKIVEVSNWGATNPQVII